MSRSLDLTKRGNASSGGNTGSPGQIQRDVMFGRTSTVSSTGPSFIPGIQNRRLTDHTIPQSSIVQFTPRTSDYSGRALKFDLHNTIPAIPDSPNWKEGMPIIVYNSDGRRGEHGQKKVQTSVQVNVAFPLVDFIRFANTDTSNPAALRLLPRDYTDICLDANGMFKYASPSEFLYEWTVVGTLVTASILQGTGISSGGISSGKFPTKKVTTVRTRPLIAVRVCGKNNSPVLWEMYGRQDVNYTGEGYQCGLLIYHAYKDVVDSTKTQLTRTKRLSLVFKACDILVAKREVETARQEVNHAYIGRVEQMTTDEKEKNMLYYKLIFGSPVFVPICTPVASSGDRFPLDSSTGELEVTTGTSRKIKKSSYLFHEDSSLDYSSMQSRMFSTVMVKTDADPIYLGNIVH